MCGRPHSTRVCPVNSAAAVGTAVVQIVAQQHNDLALGRLAPFAYVVPIPLGARSVLSNESLPTFLLPPMHTALCKYRRWSPPLLFLPSFLHPEVGSYIQCFSYLSCFRTAAHRRMYTKQNIYFCTPNILASQHFAAHRGDSATLEVLVTGGGDVSARTALKGKSPLHVAAGHAETQAVQELLLRWGADEKQLDGGGRSPSDVAGALKNVFDRGHRHAERVERIKAMLASAPRDRRWIRRRAVVMLVSRLRQEIGRERQVGGSGSAKKRGGLPEGSAEAAEQAAAAQAAAAQAAVAAATEAVQEALGDVRLEVSGGGGGGGGGDGGDASSLPAGMEAFREAVIRLGSEDDVGIFRTVVGFL